MTLHLHFTTDTGIPALGRLRHHLAQRVALHQAIGMRVQTLTVGHLKEYSETHPNQLEGPRSYYWLRAAFYAALPQSLQATPTAAILSLTTPGISRALHGVVIRPLKAKWLAIPAIDLAYNLRPAEVPGLAPFFDAQGCAGLAEASRRTRHRDTRRGKKGTTYLVANPDGLIWFWFLPYASQPQDAELLPTAEEFTHAAQAGVRDFLKEFTETRR